MNRVHFLLALIFLTMSLNLGSGQGEFKFLFKDVQSIVCSTLKKVL